MVILAPMVRFTRERASAYALGVGKWVGTKAALLQALFLGPADSGTLAGRLSGRGGARVVVGSAEISRSLRDLVRSGLLRSWRGPSRPLPGKRRLAFYELTAAGVAEAAELATGPRTRVGRTRGKAIDRRLKRSLDISAVAGALRRRGAGPTSRR